MASNSGIDPDKLQQIRSLQSQIRVYQDKNKELEKQFTDRKNLFVDREMKGRAIVEHLDKQRSGVSEEDHLVRMQVLRGMFDTVTTALEGIPARTGKILHDQEKDLMRAFRARLNDVSGELDAVRNKKGNHSAELQAQHRRVVHELHGSQELAHVFDKKHQQFTQQKQKYILELESREDNREQKIKQVVGAKKEIAVLKQKLGTMFFWNFPSTKCLKKVFILIAD